MRLVDGEPANVKVTTADDFRLGRPGGVMRIGTGYDLHRLVPGRRLVLAGVEVPFELGLDGHSDADIVCHAVTDAVLGAAAAGDIGRLFPDSDPAWKDADSLALLRQAVAQVAAAGYAVGNVDVTVVAQRPKLLPHLEAMRANLAGALAVDASCVSASRARPTRASTAWAAASRWPATPWRCCCPLVGSRAHPFVRGSGNRWLLALPSR